MDDKLFKKKFINRNDGTSIFTFVHTDHEVILT